MKQSLIELVSLILQHLEDTPDAPTSEPGMRSWLKKQGYNKGEIDQALKLVSKRLRPRQSLPRRPGTIRHLSDWESNKISPEAREALARLDLYELIEPYERELLLDRATQMEGELQIDDLDYLLNWLLYTTRDVESQQTIYSVFEGTDDTTTIH